MKKISNLKGIKVLSKKEQNKINGADIIGGCGDPGYCCRKNTVTGIIRCFPGRCLPNGGCIYL